MERQKTAHPGADPCLDQRVEEANWNEKARTSQRYAADRLSSAELSPASLEGDHVTFHAILSLYIIAHTIIQINHHLLSYLLTDLERIRDE